MASRAGQCHLPKTLLSIFVVLFKMMLSIDDIDMCFRFTCYTYDRHLVQIVDHSVLHGQYVIEQILPHIHFLYTYAPDFSPQLLVQEPIGFDAILQGPTLYYKSYKSDRQ